MPKHRRAATPPIPGSPSKQQGLSVESLRKRVETYKATGQFESALYWLDKLLSLCDEAAIDLVAYIQCLMTLNEHERALSVLKKRGLEMAHPVFQLLTIRCLHGCKRLDEAVNVCQVSCLDTSALNGCLSPQNLEYLNVKREEWSVDANLKLWLGRLYEHLDNRPQAIIAYKDALLLDVHCTEAYEALIKQHLLTSQEEIDFVEEAELLRFLYESDLRKVADMGKVGPPAKFEILSNNMGIMTARAEQLYCAGDHRSAYELTKRIQSLEDLHMPSLPLHLCVLVELFKKSQLFALAHRLVDMYPERAISWLAVGLYYYAIGLYEGAKRFFSKSTNLDPNFGQAWIAYGHSFAAQQEHDQAMNCYLKAAKLMSGCPLPQLYIGLEYSMTSNLKLGERFLRDAEQMSRQDPYILNELAVIEFSKKNYTKANTYFERVLTSVTKIAAQEGSKRLPEQWEPLLNNLGHVSRKLGHYDASIGYHKRALLLCPKSPSTLGVIGFVYLLKGDADTAIEFFHQALSLKRDSKVIPNLLSKAMDLSTGLLEKDLGFPDFPDLLPSKPGKRPLTTTAAPNLQLIEDDPPKLPPVQPSPEKVNVQLTFDSDSDMALEQSTDSMDLS